MENCICHECDVKTVAEIRTISANTLTVENVEVIAGLAQNQNRKLLRMHTCTLTILHSVASAAQRKSTVRLTFQRLDIESEK